jgi:hypothetical protein
MADVGKQMNQAGTLLVAAEPRSLGRNGPQCLGGQIGRP